MLMGDRLRNSCSRSPQKARMAGSSERRRCCRCRKCTSWCSDDSASAIARTLALAPVALGWVGTGATMRMRLPVLKPSLQPIDRRLEQVPRQSGDQDRHTCVEQQEPERLVAERHKEIRTAEAASQFRQQRRNEQVIHVDAVADGTDVADRTPPERLAREPADTARRARNQPEAQDGDGHVERYDLKVPVPA